MKHLRKPSREQRKLIIQARLKPEDWMVERDTPTKLILVHRHFDTVSREIKKENNHEDES